METPPHTHASSPNSIDRNSFSSVSTLLLAVAAVLLLTASPVQAGNLLVNPDFETPPGNAQVIATGWTYFAAPTVSPATHDYWVEQGIRAHTGTFYWKQWDALNNSAVTDVAGIYQDFSAAAGSTYQASGWFYTPTSDLMGADCADWVEVSFLDAATNVLALYKTDNFSASVGADTWFQYQVTNVCDLSSPIPSGDPYFPTYTVTGSVSQLVAPLGSKIVRYRFAYSQAGIHGSGAFDDAILNQIGGPIPPVITNLFPVNMIFVNPSDGITFNVNSPSGFTINNGAIGMVVNGVNVSGSLVISGSSSNKNVAYHGLQSNLTYTASITVTDAFGLTASANTSFETTWVGVPPVTYLWEAEDFNFTNGMYINNPALCSADGNPNCYFGKVGVEGVDEHNLNGGGSHLYRPDDPMGTAASGDLVRKNLFEAARLDYCINPFNSSEWVNYTRDWPNSTNWVIARLATDVGLNGTLTLSVVNPDASTTDLGTFTINGGHGWSSFDNVYLKDTNGNNALVLLNGKQTLRVTSGGNLLPNFFMLVAAQADLPQLSSVYPTGTHPFEYTNRFSFTVTAFGSSFPASGIQLTLDGNDVSSNLVITGSASTKNVVYPTLLPNAIHVAILALTNSLGHGIAVTNRFDTFSEDNYMVEVEDFDYDGGQHLEYVQPDSYFGFGATTNIDFQHTTLADEQFFYRIDGIPEDVLGQHDWLRSNFVYWGGIDHVLTFFAASDWANYTHEYPAGNFYVYIRSSGDHAFSMYLDQVVSGAGTVNQVTKRLGHFGGFGKDYITYDWVPLTDDGLAAPAVLKLDGLSTLRLTTDGNCNPNYFMLVPATGITLTARPAAGNTLLSFTSRAGVAYRVFYRTDLTAGNWTLLTTVAGNGAVSTVSDPVTGTARFYKVTAP
jgi:hypothetical protein